MGKSADKAAKDAATFQKMADKHARATEQAERLLKAAQECREIAERRARHGR